MKTTAKESIADKKFKESYKGMYQEIDRVSGKTFTLWNKFTMWIYSVLFGDKYHLKYKQSEYEKLESAQGFSEIQELFEPKEDASMTEEEIFKYSKRNFRK
ncbi:MAG: hypothetical protein H7A23_22970 [Leptospiraceae bacterium]|nr:hypothetical protein [Leptospiraceae bacterium]MCP5497428.1 hypothetical protein [Leptospiraceae bacterium]